MNTDCPECAGPLMVGHVGGLLEIKHAGHCELRMLEDMTKVADYDRYTQRPYGYRRPMTPTEQTLLESAGYIVPAEPWTYVQHATKGVRLRKWRDLVTAQPVVTP